jgi:hypothetical protein
VLPERAAILEWREEGRMRFSEAILLGSTVVTSEAGWVDFSKTDSGCALGMAAAAQGCTFGPGSNPIAEKDRRTLNSEDVWGNWLLRVVMRPCQCWDFQTPREMRIKDVVAHLFDYHIMERRNWTLDQLVAWVEMWEPKDGNPSQTLTADEARLIATGDAALQLHLERRREAADEAGDDEL